MYNLTTVLDNLPNYDSYNNNTSLDSSLSLYVRPTIPYKLECESMQSRSDTAHLISYSFKRADYLTMSASFPIGLLLMGVVGTFLTSCCMPVHTYMFALTRALALLALSLFYVVDMQEVYAPLE